VRRTDELTTAVIAVASGVLAAFAGASPTGLTVVDVVMVTVSVAVVTWLAAAAPPVVSGVAALAAGAFSGSVWLAALGVVAFGAAVWIQQVRLQPARMQTNVPSAALALVAMNIAARSPLDWFMGASTAVAVMLAVVLAGIGLRYRGRRTRRVVAAGCVLYAVLAVIGTAATALGGTDSLDDLRDAERAVDGALDLVVTGDSDGAVRSLDAAIASLSAVESSMNSPLTTPAAMVPVVAQHRRAAVELSQSVEAAITLLASEVDSLNLDAITAGSGVVDLEAVRDLERPLVDFQGALDDVAATIDDVRSPWLIAQVVDRIDYVEVTIEEQQRRGETAIEVVRTVPSMLGAESPRTYFVAFTTPVEVRGLGGFMGNYAEVTADNGRITVSEFGRHEDLGRVLEASQETSVIDGPADWLSLYGRFGFAGPSSPPGTSLGTWGNITMSPDVAATGEIIAQLYPNSGGRDVDGVFFADIVAVSRLLDLTGPIITSAGITLDVDNAVEFLMNGQYQVADRPERIDLLEEVARAVIDELLVGSLPPPRELLDTFGPMVEQGRVAGWAAASGEQSVFETIGLAGGLPDPAAGDAVAVTFNNAIGNKLDYFLRARAHYDTVVDAATSSVAGTVLVEIENREPSGPQPDFVMNNVSGLPRGYNRTLVSIYTRSPATDLNVDGEPVPWDAGQEAGLFVSSVFVTLEPGATAAIEVRVDGRTELDDGYRLALWSPTTASTTPVTATIEMRRPDGTAVRTTHESLAGTSTVVVPVDSET
jgi:hypothetical protein